MFLWKVFDNFVIGLYSFGWGGLNMSVLQFMWMFLKQFMIWIGGVYIFVFDVYIFYIIIGVSFVYFYLMFGYFYVISSLVDMVFFLGSDFVVVNMMKCIMIDIDGGFWIWQWNIGILKLWIVVVNWVFVEWFESRFQCIVMGMCGFYGWCISVKVFVDKV